MFKRPGSGMFSTMACIRRASAGEMGTCCRQQAPQPFLQENDLAEGETLYLQVGAFSSHENAIRMQQEIQAQNIGSVRIVEVSNDNGVLYKVQIGPLASIREADQVTRALKPLGINESRSIVQ